MAKFKVEYEDVGYAFDDGIDGAEMTELEAATYTEVKMAESSLPGHVVAIAGGRISTDAEENDSGADVKRFIIVQLVVEAPDEAAAAAIAPPNALLSEIADTIAGEHSFELEGNWEVLSAELAVEDGVVPG